MSRIVAVAVALAIAAHVLLPGLARAQPVGSGAVVQVPLEAGAPEVSAAASPSVVRLGATFTVFVTVTFEPGVEVNLREPVDLGGAFEVRRRDSLDRAGPEGKRVREYQLEVVAWDLGELQVPPIEVTFTISGHAGQIVTNAVPMRVDSVLGAVVDDPKPRGDAPPSALTARDWFWVWIAGGAAAATIAAALVWRARRHRRRTTRLTGGFAVAGGRLDTPGERALARLLAVERSGALEHDDTRKRGYTAMVDAIRDYLGTRYRVATADLTTAELMRALARVGASLDEKLQIETWLERCDVVKYGGLRATAAEARAVLAEARALVVTTTAVVVTASREAA